MRRDSDPSFEEIQLAAEELAAACRVLVDEQSSFLRARLTEAGRKYFGLPQKPK